MKTSSLIGIGLVFLSSVLPAWGQGQLVFSTRVAGLVDAPFHIPCLQQPSPNPGFTAQLFLADKGSLTPLFPATTFREQGTGAAAIAHQYVVPVDVTVPGIPPGGSATLVMFSWQTSLGSFAAAQSVGLLLHTAPVTVVLGGGLLPPANLVGLTGLATPLAGGGPYCVPEPGPLYLGTLAFSVLAAGRFFRRR